MAAMAVSGSPRSRPASLACVLLQTKQKLATGSVGQSIKMHNPFSAERTPSGQRMTQSGPDRLEQVPWGRAVMLQTDDNDDDDDSVDSEDYKVRRDRGGISTIA